MQRHLSLEVLLAAGEFRAAETAAAHHPHALGAQAQGVLNRPFHRAAKTHAPLELLRDGFGDQRGVELRLSYLDNVEADLRTRHLGQVDA